MASSSRPAPTPRGASAPPLPALPALMGALLLGALGGGLAGAWVAGSRATRQGAAEARPEPAAATPAAAAGSERVELLLSTLIEEVRGLRTAPAPSRRSAGPANGGEVESAARLEELTATLQALARSLQLAGPGAVAGGGLTVVDVPTRAPSPGELFERKSIEGEGERVRPFLLWNYQQVLDRFGPPSAVWPGGRWMYEQPGSDEQVELKFEEGLLIGIY